MKFIITSLYIVFLILFQHINLYSQTGIGEWRDHLPYRNGKQVLEVNDKIYCMTESGIFYFDKKDESINKFSKIQGLSDVNITCIGYSDVLKKMIIGYLNGNIDLVTSRVVNFPDIKNKLYSGSKKINRIYIYNTLAYLATDLGIVVFNLEKNEIKETYFFNEILSQPQVNDIVIDNDFIYAATLNGIYKANLTAGNLMDFKYWSHLENLPNPDNEVDQIEMMNGMFYLSQRSDTLEDQIYYGDGFIWNEYSLIPKQIVRSITFSKGKLFICGSNGIYIVNEFNVIESTISKYFYKYGTAIPDAYQAIIGSENNLWIADYSYGLVTKINETELYREFRPIGPYFDGSWSIAIRDSRLWLSIGGVNYQENNLWRTAALNLFENNQWKTTFNFKTGDVIKIIIDRNNPNLIYACSWGGGMIEYLNGYPVKSFNYNNLSDHTLQSCLPREGYVRVSGIAQDKNSNIWLANSGVDNLISVFKTADSSWEGFPLADYIGMNLTRDLMIDKNNFKWVILRGNGILVFDDSKPIAQGYKRFPVTYSSSSGDKSISDVYSIAEDKDGYIWVGTIEGVYVYYNPEDVFNNANFQASQILIPRKDTADSHGSVYADPLLGTSIVTTIEVDGANRKWFGTKSAGAFLFSEDGLTEIKHFDVDNSPLLSNYIIDIAVDGTTGEVFFATGNGLISYKGTASEEDDQHFTYVYPNPVRDDYNGPITITGLSANSTVKITDISGNIVYETNTLGGQAIWDGKNFDGIRVSTGVYLVFCSNIDGSKTKITKILFIH